MPTDFLNRRMDLHHNVDEGKNTLTMDTSYPVRLAGKVLKIFTASAVWSSSDWVILNTDGESILTVTSDNIFDFAGRVIKNSIGEEKSYASVQDVYKQDDYVVAIIDFDEYKIYLCSQTNFEKFITGNEDVGEKCQFKLFDVTGESSVQFNNNEIKNINNDIYNEAITFDSQDGYYSFIRNSDDNVVYQIPTKDDDGGYYAVPVSNVDVTNINAFNASCYPLMFPFITSSYQNDFEIVRSCRNFVQFSGTVNEKFIKDCCYTASELKALPFITYNSSTGSIKSNVLVYSTSFISNIFNQKKENEYIYFFRDLIGSGEIENDGYSTNLPKTSITIIPIPLDTYRFSELEIIDGDKNMCNGFDMELNMLTAGGLGLSSTIIGNWWTGNFVDGDTAWTFSFNVKSQPSALRFLITPNENCFNYQDSYDMFSYKLAHSDLWSAFEIIRVSPYSSDKYYMTTPSGADLAQDIINFSPEGKKVKKIINFFSNKDDQYETYICRTLTSTINETDEMVYFTKTNEQFLYDPTSSPVATSMMCDEQLMMYIDNTNSKSSLVDYCKDLLDGFTDLKSYTYKTNTCGSGTDYTDIDTEELYALAYKLTNYSVSDINSPDNKLDYDVIQIDNQTRFVYSNYDLISKTPKNFKFKVSKDFLPNSNNSNSSFLSVRNSKSKTYDLFICHFLSRGLVRAIDTSYNSDKVLHSDVSTTKILMKAKMFHARKHLMNTMPKYLYFDNDVLNIYEIKDNEYVNSGSFNNYKTWVFSKEDNNSLVPTTVTALKNALAFNKTAYLYYEKTPGIWYRFKLLVNSVSYDYNWNTITDINNHFGTYDYFLDPIMIINTPGGLSKLSSYDKAYCAAKGDTYNNLILSQNFDEDPKVRIATVIETYFLYGSGIMNNKVKLPQAQGLLVPCFVDKKYMKNENEYEHVTTLSLTTTLDYRFHRYLKNSTSGVDSNNNPISFKLSDFIPENTFTYTDGPAPRLSKTKNSNNQYVYNIDTYKDFISNVYITKYTYDTDSNISNTVKPLLNDIQLKYINGKGIREEYYKNKTIYDFFRYMSLYDLAVPMADQKIDSMSDTNIAIYDKSTFNSVTDVKFFDDGERYMVDSSGNKVTAKASNIIICKIDNNNRFGFNQVYIQGTGQKDVTNDYISVDKIYASKEQAGNKSVLNISLNDQDNVLLNINGILGTIECNTLNWNNLLLALSNNKTIDILSDALINMKKSINQSFIKSGQNINDIITITNNANPSTDIATFNSDTNVYDYNYTKGFDDNDYRQINNRGVIVFTLSNGYSRLNRNGSLDESIWTEDVNASVIQAKRMFISKDGLICTKEYFDRESATDVDEKSTIKALQQKIKDLETRLTALESK